MKKTALCLLLLIILMSSQSFAAFDTPRASPWTKKTEYSEKTIAKLGFGMRNLTEGWMAMPQEMDKKESPNQFTNFFRGFYLGTINTVGGLAHVLTFPIPKDIPLPGGGIRFKSPSERDMADMALPIEQTTL